MPVVTVMSRHDGLQPRVSAVRAYGLAGVLPAMGFLVAVVLTASLLAFGRHAPSRASLTSAEGMAGLVLMVGLLAPSAFHVPGSVRALLAIVVATAVVTSEVLRQSPGRIDG